MTSLFVKGDIVKSEKKNLNSFWETLQLSIFNRKRQIYLLKDVNWCTYMFSNSVAVRRCVSQSLGEWLYIVHCHKCQLRGGWSIFLFEMEPPLYWNLVCSIEMFRINIKTASATMLLVCSTWKRLIQEDIIGLVTWMKRYTYMTSLTCAVSAIVGTFNKG